VDGCPDKCWLSHYSDSQECRERCLSEINTSHLHKYSNWLCSAPNYQAYVGRECSELESSAHPATRVFVFLNVSD